MPPALEEKLLHFVDQVLPRCGAIVLSDYGKGVLSDLLLRRIIDAANHQSVPVIVDPKSSDFSLYKGASVITPNEREVASSVPIKIKDNEDLGRAAEYRDNETGMHVIRMSRLSAKLAKEIGLTDEACQLMLQASPIHDVGKIGIPDEILLKPGKMNEKEWKIMKKHPYLVDIFKRALPEMIRIVKELPDEDSADVLKVYRKNGSNKWPQKSLSSIR